MDHGVGNPLCEREARLFVHVADLAMHRQDELRAQPAVECGEFGLPRMAADMDMRLLFGDGQHVLPRVLVNDPPDSDLIPRNLIRRADECVTRLQLILMYTNDWRFRKEWVG